MKNSLLRILFCLIAVTIGLAPLTNSQAQVYTTCPGTDELAIFFDNGDINYNPQINVPFNVYFTISNPTAGCVEGVEFSLGNPDTPLYFVLSQTFPVNAINIGTPPDYVIGFATPVPIGSNQALVMTQQVMVLVNEPYQYFLSPTAIPSIAGNLAYACGQDLLPLSVVSGDFALPVAQLNGTPLSYCNQPAPLDLSVYINFDGDNDNIAGTSEGATDGYDAEYDQVDNNLSLTFPHPEWGANAGNYRHDIKAAFDPTQEVRQWTFVANAQVPQSDARYVSLSFQPNFAVDPDMDFQLYDRATGATTDLFQQNTFQYYLSDGETFNRTFDLFIGRDVVVDPNLWVDVTASTVSYSETTNRLGTEPLATDGYDPGLDIPEPTPPPSNYVGSSFIHANWPLGPRFQTDVRAVYDPTTETKTWPLRVETDQSGQVVLDFTASFTAADDIGLQLYDRQSGQTFNLFPQMNYAFEANGVSTYWFDIIVGVSGPPALSPTSRTIGSGWALVGLPLMPANRTLSEVLLDQTPGYAFMFDYQSGLGYNLLEPTTMAAQDQGYWLATDSAFTWTMTGQPNLAGQLVPLTPGWNLVGNPMWFSGPFEGMAVVHNGVTISWLQAVSSGLVATGVQSYNQNTGGYFDAVDLQPWHGYWINALVPNLHLVFQWENFQNLPARLTADKSGIHVDERVWSADLTLWDSKRLQTTITMGFNPEATEGFDPRFDMPKAPAPPSGGPILAFTRPEWDLASGAYFSRDVMPPSDEEMVWNAVISVENSGTANLIWDSSNWPKTADFQIYLPTENRVVVMSMRAQSSVQFEIGDEPLPIVIRTPSMATGVDDIPGLAYKVSVYPNPFNPMTTVNFDLPRGGDVEIRLYSVRGELVNVLAGEHYVAGSHKVVWQGNDRSGRSVPSGSYFAKLFVDGQAMGSVTKMSLVR